ncbi:protein mbtH [Tsukamurella pulmonis]|uniref:MbtH family protein n=1 Tax=Tsukamurella pulmonis TaxID=47312 RepID=UPI00079A0D98|nr:MbtH family protein [Tsukamurella pulmonis]KXP11419.1 protein mbtH [Tsukamurella pulmonis]RDH13393.1 MbtH family protein [Tsukamurella pulmonis]
MNPFDDPDAGFLVLRNAGDQRSLWPRFARVPAGWSVEYGPASRADCRDHVDAVWTDLRPQPVPLPR